MELLKGINSLHDFKQLKKEQLPLLAQEIRQYITEVVSKNGGHLASNLGVVELTLALHYVYNSPTDKIIWDVGHQSYIHKLLTGRREQLLTLRTLNGLSGFPKSCESQHDAFNTGHSSTSISSALGFARARDLDGQSYNVTAVIGDGALGGGMAFEALNDVGFFQNKMLIIINDNTMSISKNVGGLSKHLSKLRVSKRYVSFKHGIKRGFSAIPLVGKPLARGLEKSRDFFRFMVVKNKMFDQLGLKYIGPIDGHDIKTIISYLEQIKNINRPVVLHIITSKGKGLQEAENDPATFHGLSSNQSANDSLSFSYAVGKKLSELAENNEDIVALSAAMTSGTGLDTFQSKYPNRFFDVGIAEQHAVTCAAGLAKSGKKPYVAVYSTFLQRGFDQILHDVCLQNLPVTFLLDRAGIVGEDGETHQGIYDLAYLNLMPNMTIIAPKDVAELNKALEFSVNFNAPLAIRYPKCSATEYNSGVVQLGKWEVLNEGSKKTAIIAVGSKMLQLAHNFLDCKIINPKFIKPLDEKMLAELAENGYSLMVLEESVSGGLFTQIANYYAIKNLSVKMVTIPIPSVVEHGSLSDVFDKLGLTVKNISNLLP